MEMQKSQKDANSFNMILIRRYFALKDISARKNLKLFNLLPGKAGGVLHQWNRLGRICRNRNSAGAIREIVVC